MQSSRETSTRDCVATDIWKLRWLWSSIIPCRAFITTFAKLFAHSRQICWRWRFFFVEVRSKQDKNFPFRVVSHFYKSNSQRFIVGVVEGYYLEKTSEFIERFLCVLQSRPFFSGGNHRGRGYHVLHLLWSATFVFFF